jgi:hypothetical protein
MRTACQSPQQLVPHLPVCTSYENLDWLIHTASSRKFRPASRDTAHSLVIPGRPEGSNPESVTRTPKPIPGSTAMKLRRPRNDIMK